MMEKITRYDYRLDDVEAVEKLEEIYSITYDWFDEDTGEFVYSEPVIWVYNDDYYEIDESDFN